MLEQHDTSDIQHDQVVDSATASLLRATMFDVDGSTLLPYAERVKPDSEFMSALSMGVGLGMHLKRSDEEGVHVDHDKVFRKYVDTVCEFDKVERDVYELRFVKTGARMANVAFLGFLGVADIIDGILSHNSASIGAGVVMVGVSTLLEKVVIPRNTDNRIVVAEETFAEAKQKLDTFVEL